MKLFLTPLNEVVYFAAAAAENINTKTKEKLSSRIKMKNHYDR